MKIVEIWDKISEINGVNAELIMETNKWINREEAILIKENGIVTNIEQPSILKSILEITEEKSTLEIGNLWVNYLNEQEDLRQQTQLEEVNQQQKILSNQELILAGLDALILR